MKHTTMKRLMALLLALLLGLSTIALAEESVVAGEGTIVEPGEAAVGSGEVVQEQEKQDEEAVEGADDAAGDDAAEGAADDDADDTDDDADADEIIAAVAEEEVSISAEAVDAVIEEGEEELIDEAELESEMELGEDEAFQDLFEDNISPGLKIVLGDMEVPFQNDTAVPGAYYDVDGEGNATLTLTNYNADKAFSGLEVYGEPNVPLTLVLNGTSYLTSHNNKGFKSDYQDSAVYSKVPLTVTGGGTLNIVLDSDNCSSFTACGIYAPKFYMDSGKINISANEGDYWWLEGICALVLDEENNGANETSMFRLDGGEIDINLNLDLGEFGFVNGVFGWNAECYGGTLDITVGKALQSKGIRFGQSLTIRDCTLTAFSEGISEGGDEYEGAIAAGVYSETETGKVVLGSGLKLTYGVNESKAEVHTVDQLNALLTTEDVPEYVHVEAGSDDPVDPVNPVTPTTPSTPEGTPPSFPADSLFFATVVSEGETALNLKWTPANNVDGYDVFLKRCRNKKAPFEVVATTASGVCTTIVTGLMKNKCYKGYVQAFVMEGDVKKYVLDPSKRFHVYTNNGRKGLSNPDSLEIKYSKTEQNAGQEKNKVKNVRVGKTKKIKAKITGAKTGTVIRHVAKLRLFSSNPNVATVVWKKAKKGKKGYVGVKGVGEGSCKVYVLTNNGICDWFTVNVTK